MLILGLAINAFAANETEGICYILKDNANITKWINGDKPWSLKIEDGVVSFKDWDSILIGTNTPTFEQIYAVTNLAVPWYKDKIKDVKADVDEVSPEVMKAIVTAMIKVINKRIGSDKITAAEMKTAIKNELK
jgi:hypothetical protein